MHFLSRIIFLGYWLVLMQAAIAQTGKVDSLLKKVYAANNGSAKLNAILLLCEEHQSMKRDSLDKYALIAKELSLQSGDKKMQAKAAWLMGNSYLRWGWTDSALAAVSPYLEKGSLLTVEDRTLYFKLARVKAMCYASKSNFKDALSVLYKVIHLAEQHRDSLAWGMNLNTLASIALAREQPAEALQWLSAATAVSPNRMPYAPTLAAICTNFAQAYHKLHKQDSARFFIEKALRLSREVANLNTLATALRVQSTICTGEGNFGKAEEALKEMIEVRRSTNDGAGVVDDNLMLIDFYLQTDQAQKGILLCETALQQGNIYAEGGHTYTNNVNLRLSYFEALARCYKAVGEEQLYQRTLEQIIQAKDSFYLTNAAKAIEELKVQYEVQKKENKIIQQEFALTKKNLLFYGAVVFSFLVLVIGWLIFRNNRRKQILKMKLMQQEEKQLAAEAVKNAEEAERRRIAADLHDNLGAYATSIVSNVDYLKMQEQKLHDTATLDALHNNAQSIMSQLGDTIWVLKKDALPLTAISDRLKAFIQRLAPSYPQITLNIFEQITTDHLLPPSHTFHLFQLVKEGIVNAVKHSGGHLINVSIEGNESWSVTITDDGSGMKEKLRGEGGNGLVNMQSRAGECGWAIEWLPNYPQGTSVLIQPLTVD